jgi:predicted nuclease with TOPRIM domain
MLKKLFGKKTNEIKKQNENLLIENKLLKEKIEKIQEEKILLEENNKVLSKENEVLIDKYKKLAEGRKHKAKAAKLKWLNAEYGENYGNE